MKQIVFLLCISMFISHCDRVKKLAGVKSNGNGNGEKLPPVDNSLNEDKLKSLDARVQNLEEALGSANQKIENTELAIESLESRVERFHKGGSRAPQAPPRASRPVYSPKIKPRRTQKQIVPQRGAHLYHIQIGAYSVLGNAQAFHGYIKDKVNIEFTVKESEAQNYYDGDVAAHMKQMKQTLPLTSDVLLYKVVSKNAFTLTHAHNLLALLKKKGYSACLVAAKGNLKGT